MKRSVIFVVALSALAAGAADVGVVAPNVLFTRGRLYDKVALAICGRRGSPGDEER